MIWTALSGATVALALCLSWRSDARSSAIILAAIWLAVTASSYTLGFDTTNYVGCGLNVLAIFGFLALWSARNRWWMLALAGTFAFQNYLHFAEAGTIIGVQATLTGDALAWAEYDTKHKLWESLYAVNAIQRLLVIVGPRSHVLADLYRSVFSDPCRDRGARGKVRPREEAGA